MGIIRRTVPFKQNLGQIEELAYEEDPAGAKGKATREAVNTETRHVVYRDQQGNVVNNAEVQQIRTVEGSGSKRASTGLTGQNLKTIQNGPNHLRNQVSGGSRLVSGQMEQNSGRPGAQIHRKVVSTVTQKSGTGTRTNVPNEDNQRLVRVVNKQGQVEYVNRANIVSERREMGAPGTGSNPVSLKPNLNVTNEYRTENQMTNILLSHNQPKLISGAHSKVIHTEAGPSPVQNAQRETQGITRHKTTSEIIFQNSGVDSRGVTPVDSGGHKPRNQREPTENAVDVHPVFYNDLGSNTEAGARPVRNQEAIINSHVISQGQTQKVVSSTSKSPNKKKRTKITQNRVVTREVTIKKPGNADRPSPARSPSPMRTQQTISKSPAPQQRVISTVNNNRRVVLGQQSQSKSPVQQARSVSPIQARHHVHPNSSVQNRNVVTTRTVVHNRNVTPNRNMPHHQSPNQITNTNYAPNRNMVENRATPSPHRRVVTNTNTNIVHTQAKVHGQRTPAQGTIQTQFYRPTATPLQAHKVPEYSSNRFRQNTTRFEEVINRSAAFTFKNGSFKTGKLGQKTGTLTTRIPDRIPNASPNQAIPKSRIFQNTIQMRPKKPTALENDDHIKIDTFIMIQNKHRRPGDSNREIDRIDQNLRRSRTPAKRTPQTGPRRHVETQRVLQRNVRSVSPFKLASSGLPVKQRDKVIKRSVKMGNKSTVQVQQPRSNRNINRKVTVRTETQQISRAPQISRNQQIRHSPQLAHTPQAQQKQLRRVQEQRKQCRTH